MSSALPSRVTHLGDVTQAVASYFVKLSDGRTYRVDRRHSTRTLRVRMIPSGRCVTLSEVTKAAIGVQIDRLCYAQQAKAVGAVCDPESIEHGEPS